MARSKMQLSVIAASAGSGKTYTVTERLEKQIRSGETAPDSIAAITFTEAGAAEMRSRIRERLQQKGLHDEAERLDESYLTTLHGFGLRLLKEQAFDLGRPIRQRHLTEEEADQLLNQAMSQSAAVEQLSQRLEDFSYTYDHGQKLSGEVVFRRTLQALIHHLRSMGRTQADAQALIADASAALKALYKPATAKTSEKYTANLHKAVKALLAKHPNSQAAEHGGSKSGRNELTADFRALQDASIPDALATNWPLWSRLRKLRTTKMPADYVALADAVKEAAQKLDNHIGPFESAVEHLSLLITGASETLDRFQELKREIGAIDYGDMIAGAADALQRNDIRDLLAQRLDQLVIDEFQDTNATQFSMAWPLVQAGVRSLIVGDAKQSIYRFQGADVDLFQALIKEPFAEQEKLPNNYRSQKELLRFVNATTKKLFPEGFQRLGAKGANSKLKPIHVLELRGTKWNDQNKASRVAELIHRKLSGSQSKVVDRQSGKSRPIRPCDIAVLCTTNSKVAKYANTLREYGLRVRTRESGWFEQPEVQIALSVLKLASNPDDAHARLLLSTTDLGEDKLQNALGKLLQGAKLSSAAQDRITDLHSYAQRVAISEGVPTILESSGLLDHAATCSNARQARANILKLIGKAAEFENLPDEALAAEGFHGRGLPVFIAWITHTCERDDEQPDASVIDEEAVEVRTIHSAKGLEWPVTVICGLDSKAEPRLPETISTVKNYNKLANLRELTQLRFYPKFDGTMARQRMKEALAPEREAEALRLLYVAITRAREQLVIEWPSRLLEPLKTTTTDTGEIAFSSPSYLSLLVQQTGMELRDSGLHVGRTTVEALHTIITEASEAEPPDTFTQVELPDYGRLAITPPKQPLALGPLESLSPSLASPPDSGHNFRTVSYAEPLKLPQGGPPEAIGTFLHRCFEIPTDHPGYDPFVEAGVQQLWPTAPTETAAAIIQHRHAFDACLSTQFPGATHSHEVDVMGKASDGAIIAGAIDLLIESNQGAAIIDHKASHAPAEVLWERYGGQLAAYRTALGREKDTIVGINAVLHGDLLLST